MKKLIKENKIRSQMFETPFRQIATYLKTNFDSSIDNQKVFSVGAKTLIVKVYSDSLFRQLYPKQPNTNSFYQPGTNHIVLRVNQDTTFAEIIDRLFHETEHFFDYNDNEENMFGMKQRNLQNAVYDIVKTVPSSDTVNTMQGKQKENVILIKAINLLLYRLWINTEVNGFGSKAMLQGYDFKEDFALLERAIGIVEDTPIDDSNIQIWSQLGTIRRNSKNYSKMKTANNRMKFFKDLKTFFVSRTKDKFKRFKNIIIKKYEFQQMRRRNSRLS